MSRFPIPFAYLNKFFDKIYVLTLERAPERHKHIEKELAGLNYSFFFGKDKQYFDINALQDDGIYDEALAKKHHRYNKPMPKGHIGCSWGHKLIYQDMLKNNYQQILVLEDDAVVNTEAINLLPVMMKELPLDWQLLYFGFEANEKAPFIAPITQLYYHLLRNLNLVRLSRTTIQNIYPKKLSKYINTAGLHNCTHAYALKASTATLLIELQTPISFWADHLLAYAITNKLIKAYSLTPKLINQQYQLTDEKTFSFIND